MEIIFKYLFRSLSHKKLRTVAVILSISIISATILANLCTTRIVSQAYRKMTKNAYGDIQVTLSRKDLSLFSVDDVDPIDSLVEKRVDIISAIGIVEIENGKKLKVNVLAGDYNQFLAASLVESGNLEKPDPNKDYLIISEHTAEKYNWQVGESIFVNIDGIGYVLTISDIYNNFGLFYDEKSEINFLISKSVFDKALNADNLVNSVYLGTTKAPISEYLKGLQENNADFDVKNVYNEASINTMISNVNMILMFVLILVGFMGTMIIVTLYTHILEDRIPVIGTIQSLGIRRTATTRLLLMESLIYGITGGILGQLLGFFMVRFFINNIFSAMDSVFVSGANILITDLIIAFAFTILWTLIIAFFFIIKTRRMNIRSEIIKYGQSPFVLKIKSILYGAILLILAGILFVIQKRIPAPIGVVLSAVACISIILGAMFLFQVSIYGLGQLFGRIILASSEKTMIAIRNLRRNKILMKCIYVSAIIFGLTISMLIISTSVDQVFNYLNQYSFDIIVRTDKYSNKDYSAIQELNSVKDAFFLYNSKADFRANGIRVSGRLVGREKGDCFDEYLYGSLKLDQRDLDYLDDNKIILDDKLLQKLNVSTGETVELIYNDEIYNLEIIGTMDSYYFASECNTAVVAKEFYLQYVMNVPSTIYVNSKSETQDTMQELSDYLLDTYSTVETKTAYFEQQQRNSDVILLIVRISLFMGVIVGFIGVLNNIWLGYIRRKKEFAVCLASAMGRKSLLRQIVIEILFSSLCVGILLEVFSIIVTFALKQMLERIDLHLDIVYSWRYSIIVFIFAVLVYLSSAIIPQKIVANINILNELKQMNE